MVFTAFELGQIFAHQHHGLNAAEISRIVLKPGATKKSKKQHKHFSHTGISDAMTKLAENPKWRGERKKGSGRKRTTTAAFDAEVVKVLFADRGKRKVTLPYLQRVVPNAQQHSKKVLARCLHDAELKKLRRRRKIIVPGSEYKDARIEQADKILETPAAKLRKWCYVDGTVIGLYVHGS